MKYELRSDGDVYQDDDIDELRKTKLNPNADWILYEVVISKMDKVPYESPSTKPCDEKLKEVKKIPRPNLLNPLLSYEMVLKASYWASQGVTKKHISERLYCSMAKIITSLAWYEQTGSHEEYDSYNPFKKNLAESK